MDCRCTQPPFRSSEFQLRHLGVDAHWGEVSVQTCRQCQRSWLNYLIEEEHHSRSGRWWRAPLPAAAAADLDAAGARAFIEHCSWCFVGGSWLDSSGMRVSAPIRIR